MRGVHRRKDCGGAFEIDFRVNGKRFREMVQARTEREAAQIRAERMAEEGTGTDLVEGPTLTIEEAWQRWKEETARKAEDATRARSFVDWFGATKEIGLVRVRHVSAWMDSRIKKTAKATTIRREVTSLSNLFRWAIARGYLETNPAREAPKPPASYDPPEDVQTSEIATILDAIKGDPVLEPTYLLAFYAGLLRAEIVRVRWSDIDLAAETISIEKGKTRFRKATIPLFEPLLGWLRANHRDAGYVVCGRHGDGLLPNSLHERMDRWNKNPKNVVKLPNFHRCRHTCATVLAKQNVPPHIISQFLRWSNSKMLEQTYGHYGALDFRDRLKVITEAMTPRAGDQSSDRDASI